MLGGMVIPLFGLTRYALFLAAILLLGGGVSIMQVAGNPVVRDLSVPEKYSRNLSLAQFIKAIGSISASLIIFFAAKWLNKDEGWQIVFPIYVAALLATTILVALTRIEEHKVEAGKPATFRSCLALLGNSYVLVMVLGIFVYVGAEVCISTHMPMYLNKKFSVDLKTQAILGNTYFFFGLLTGRFLGSVVLTWILAKKFLLATVLIAIVGLLGLLTAGDQMIANLSVMLAGVGCANVFPLIFSITIDSMPERSNEISGLMVTAIVGGAFLPPLMGLLVDQTESVTLGFLVPLACCLYLVYAALFSLKVRPIPDET
jgi:fucose permease